MPMYRRPVHLRAECSDLSDKVVISGDPYRVKALAESHLEDVKLVAEHRGFIAYTGYYRNDRISVVCHGIGAPSLSIIVKELIMCGARTIVRLGSAGSLVSYMHRGDVFIPIAAGYAYRSATSQLSDPDLVVPAVPDVELSLRLYETLRTRGIRAFIGAVFSNDVFYREDAEMARRLSRYGFSAIEMECSALYMLSRLNNVRSACVLVILNSLVNPDESDIPSSEDSIGYFMRVFPCVLDVLVEQIG